MSRSPSIFVALPRRPKAPAVGQAVGPGMAQDIRFKTNPWLVLGRLTIFLIAVGRFTWGILRDTVAGSNTIQRRAWRARITLETMGPSFVKLGQQLSLRADILPWAYCEEFSQLLDRGKAMSLPQAEAAIERVTGQPVAASFRVIDPEPLGCASIACVYLAETLAGERVAIKVRRPGIGPELATDIWLLVAFARCLEWLTLLREDATRNLPTEIGSMLMEELDFRHEARNMELWSRSVKRCRLRHVRAPRVHTALSGDDVLVTEMIDAIPLQELLAAVDRRDDVALAAFAAQGIRPERIARRLMVAWHWEVFHFSVFHADPHPANIFVEPGDRLVFIDFGSCGRVGSRSRGLIRRISTQLAERDSDGAAQTALQLLEPLPSLDVHGLLKDLEALYWTYNRASMSHQAAWWEKSSGHLWLRFAGVAQSWGLPLNVDTLRLFRATFLFDTVVVRLDPAIDVPRTFRHFLKDEAPRLQRTLRRRVGGMLHPQSRAHLLLRLLETGNGFQDRLFDATQSPAPNFSYLPGTVARSVVGWLRAAASLFVLTVLLAGAYDVWVEGDAIPDPSMAMVGDVGSHPMVLALYVLVLTLVIRRTNERLLRATR